MSVLYEETISSWENAEFHFNNDFTAHLKLWEDDIEPEQVWESKTRLDNRVESFRVALKYLGNRSIIFKIKNWPTCHFDRGHSVRTKQEFAIITDYLRGRRESYSVGYCVLPELIVEAHSSSLAMQMPNSMPSSPKTSMGLLKHRCSGGTVEVS